MALMAPPPWISDISPRLFLDASSSGARLGLERAGQTLQAGSIANQATEAADKLRESYAALASQNALARAAQQAAQSYHMAGLGLRSNALDSLNDFRDARVGQHQEGLDIAKDRLSGLNAAKIVKSGNGVYKWENGQLTPLVEPKAALDPVKRFQYQSLYQRLNKAHAAMMDPAVSGDPTAQAAIQKELDDVNAQMKALDSPGAGASLDSPMAFPPGALDSIGNPAGPATWNPPVNMDMSGYTSPLSDAADASSQEKAASVRKYKVRTLPPLGQ